MAKLILIVDDEESIRQTLNGILEDEGYKTIEAENGSAALDIIQEESPDLVLLDIWMPGMDGIQTLEMIRQRFPETTAVMMSGHGTIETAVRATRIGAFDFIEKPFSLDKLLITITNALNYKELRRENEALRLAVIRQNHAVLRRVIPSYTHQVEKAARRGDWVSVNHRVAALLASYFDVIFALNRVLHPGEKRLVQIVEERCPLRPAGMAEQIQAVLAASAGGGENLDAQVNVLIDSLDRLLLAEGFDPATSEPVG